MRELVVNSAGASQFVPQNGTTCHDKIVAKSRASVSLAKCAQLLRKIFVT